MRGISLLFLTLANGLFLAACGGGGDSSGSGGSGGGSAGGGSTATEIVSGEKAWGVVADGADLYWTSNADPNASIRRAASDGSGATTLCSFDQYVTVEPLVVDAQNVYALAGSGAANLYRVSRTASTAGPCTPLLDPAAYTFSVAWAVAQTASRVYFALAPTGNMQSTTIGFVDKSSGQVTEITTVSERVLGEIASDDKFVYFTSGPVTQEKLYRVAAAAGSAPSPVLDGQFYHPLLDGGYLYGSSGVVDLSSNTLANVSFDYSPTQPISSVSDLQIAGTELFVLRNGASPNAVWHGPKAGGTFTLLCKAGTFPNRLAVSANAVFFTDTDDGSIRKCAR